jgi:hypothetical protein
MKKVIALLAVVSMVSFAACNNAPKQEENEAIEIELTAADEDGGEEEVEEVVETPSK